MSKYIFDLRQNNLRNISAKLVGGKAFSLIILSKNGITVPGGFVVNCNVFEEFSNEKMSQSLIFEIESKIKKVGARRYAVRSSANIEDASENSWAGQFESYLNVPSQKVIKNIKKCWTSVFNDRVIGYGDKKNLSKIKMAVIVQESIDSDVSGACFTRNPLDKNDKNIFIEAVWGLGEILMQGKTIPDRYEVERRSNIILNADVNKQNVICKTLKNGGIKIMPIKKIFKQKLSGKEIIYLAKMAQKIEKIYRKGCDIEWCKKGNNIYILQARPITTSGILHEKKNKL